MKTKQLAIIISVLLPIKLFCEWPIFSFMMNSFINMEHKNIITQQDNAFQNGFICKKSRLCGTNALPQLFEEMRRQTTKKYPMAITFINKIDNRSDQIHCNKLKQDVANDLSQITMVIMA